MKIDLSRIPAEVHLAARRIVGTGGSAYLVGGAVIDLLHNRAAKDWDIEVFGLGYTQIAALFPDYSCKDVGRAFGILKLDVDGVDIDVNVPRVDNKVGVGHKDFVVEFDPTMTVKEAARRRDFTINTLAICLQTGEVVDEWGGLADLEAGVLRATDPVLFVQDALRGLRAMQLLPRKARSVDAATMDLIRIMGAEFEFLAKERIHEEFRKLLLKAAKPSVGLEFLVDSGWIQFFPVLDALRGCGQNPDWHPEGDVWTHSCLAADAAAQIRHLIPEHQREAFVFGTLLHDVGKPETTITPEMVAADEAPASLLWTARKHPQKGKDPAESFLRQMTNNKKLIQLTKEIVGQHMQPYHLYRGNASKGKYAKLAGKMEAAGGDLLLLTRVCQCDSCATGENWQTRSLASGAPNWEHEISQRMGQYAADFEEDRSVVEPKVRGKHLVAHLGLNPGKRGDIRIGPACDVAKEAQYADAELSFEQLLQIAADAYLAS